MTATILIADDDAVQRRLVENMVRRSGYEAIVVEGGDAAIAALTTSDGPVIDALILDLVMPGLDGMGVLAKIREAGISVPVIVQTAHGGIDNVGSADARRPNRQGRCKEDCSAGRSPGRADAS
jgi:DNA-binding NtrC family response regulator